MDFKICGFTMDFMKLAYMRFRPLNRKVFQTKDQKETYPEQEKRKMEFTLFLVS